MMMSKRVTGLDPVVRVTFVGPGGDMIGLDRFWLLRLRNPRDQHYFERRLKHLAKESLKRNIRKVEKEFRWYSAERKRKLVRRRTKCRLRECRRALQIEHSDAEYAMLRAEVLTLPQPPSRPRSPESVGSHVARSSAPPPDSPVQIFSPPPQHLQSTLTYLRIQRRTKIQKSHHSTT
ncbi:hypothetical protein Vadar_008674 [Vaccinium darrowii]|uniref:Uncharacterized protein n=1 Tax=Vaccinium darrowii TaxID=229202 RepID=A0ACB7YCD0_9ERIC|nr:hypothetical protein Vadar_008674 [Vaccinium darrowii]